MTPWKIALKNAALIFPGNAEKSIVTKFGFSGNTLAELPTCSLEYQEESFSPVEDTLIKRKQNFLSYFFPLKAFIPIFGDK